jgi:DNA-binding MarR family transcriptional regulator
MDFDENLASPARLMIIAALVPGRPLTFTELKAVSGLADGNLHVQTRKLEAVGYVEISKSARGRRTLTRFRMTELGVESLKLHVRKLQSILATESGEIRIRTASSRGDDSEVWR